jgi:hypothetical protein
MDGSKFSEVKEATAVLDFIITSRREAAAVLKAVADARAGDGLDDSHCEDIESTLTKGQSMMHIDEFKAVLRLSTRVTEEKDWIARLAEQCENGRWTGPNGPPTSAVSTPKSPSAAAADSKSPRAGAAGRVVYSGDYDAYPPANSLNVDELKAVVSDTTAFAPDMYAGRIALRTATRVLAVRTALRAGALGTQNEKAWNAVAQELQAFNTDKELGIVRGSTSIANAAERTATLSALFVEPATLMVEFNAVSAELEYQRLVQSVTAKLVQAQSESDEKLLEDALAEADAAKMLDKHNPERVNAQLLLTRLRNIRVLLRDVCVLCVCLCCFAWCV